MIDPAKPLRAGNIYALMAMAAIAMVDSGQSEPLGLVIQVDGTVSIYSHEVTQSDDPGFIGWMSADSDPARLAQRIAAAHTKLMTH